MSPHNTPKTRFVLPAIILLLITATNALAAGIGLGAGPSDILFENLMRGGYSERILTVSTSAKTNLSVTVTKEGELADWITVTPSEFMLPEEGRKEVMVSIEPPGDAANRMYSGRLYVKASPVSGVSGGSGSAIGARVVVSIKANVSGAEAINYHITDAKVYDTEIGYPIEFQLKIVNDGNVKVTPRILFNLSGPEEKPEVTSFVRNSTEILPSRTSDTVITVPSSNLKPGKYNAEVGYFSYERDSQTGKITEKYARFKSVGLNLLPEGSLSAKGYLESLVLSASSVKVGDTIKINGVFKNMGTTLLNPTLECEVLEGARLEAKIDGKEVSVYPSQTKNLEAYYTTRAKGKYNVNCFVSYGRYETPKKTADLEVGGGLDTTYIIVLAVAVSAGYLAYKKGYLGGRGKRGRFQEV